MYQACDGTTFEDMEECQLHEKIILTCRLRMCDIEFWDKERHNMLHPLFTDDKYEDKMDGLYAVCEYLNITKDVPLSVKFYIKDTWGWIIPSEKGVYKYDWGKMEWIREI